MNTQCSLERHWCSELVSIVFPKSKASHRIVGNLEEIGENSAVVLTDDPVPVGNKVWIARKAHVLRGRVETITGDPTLGFFMEIKLAPASRWSRRWFTPQHFFTPHVAQLRRSA